MVRSAYMVVMVAKTHIDHKVTKCISCEFMVAKSEWKQQDFICEVFIWQEFMWLINMMETEKT